MNKKVVSAIGIIISVTLLIIGVLTKIPEKRISSFSTKDDGYTEYVGGDAYNYQIEASLRGGQIAGARTERAVYISMSGLIFIISMFGLCKSENYNNEEVYVQEEIEQ